jgi:hypothetical protein
MRQIGELDWAEDEIDWATRESDPVEVPPCDIGELIKDREHFINLGFFGTPITRVGTEESTERITTSEETSQSSVSVFDLSNYPPPWPLVPFSAPPLKLQKKIPLHLLPQKLIVHDPWNLLFVDERVVGEEDTDVKWTSKDDIVRTYHLKLSTAGKEKVEKELQLRGDLEAKCKDIGQREGSLIMPNSHTSGPATPAIMVFPPLCPPPPESVPEAHLYLSPAHPAGTGHHSVVYNAEWELPRSMLVKDVLCQKCLEAQVAEELKELETRGEYHPGGVSRNGSTEDSSLESLPKISIQEERLPAVTTTFINFQELEAEKGGGNSTGGTDGGSREIHTIEPPRIMHTRTYEGPVVKVFPEVKWQNPEREPYCPHVLGSMRCEKVPLTAKVNVAAKLSKQDDGHLGPEAENYQSFPAHLFEHWSGYNVVPPLHNPFPLGAAVPQFYGYYVPEENDENQAAPYLSPILLLENCGIPIDPDALNQDDKEECASLLYRFHEASWIHGSYAARNILTQPGPLSQWPPFRIISDIKSFRLIDFGRSSNCSSGSRAMEEMTANQLFHIPPYQVQVEE